MSITKYDLCDSCRSLKMGNEKTGDTFGEFIDKCLVSRGGTFTNPMDLMLTFQCIAVNLESNGGCSRCISFFKKKGNM
jgi:hypothetical protein